MPDWFWGTGVGGFLIGLYELFSGREHDYSVQKRIEGYLRKVRVATDNDGFIDDLRKSLSQFEVL